MTAVSFFVNRLYVLAADNRVAYDECYHHGINIIRGENSSGKSTITHLLFFGLGGDYTHFAPEAQRCSRVMVEVEADGAVITLSRPLAKDKEGRILTQQPMTIHWGPLSEALAGTCRSNTFGYRTSPNKSSFSNVLFEAMGIPLVKADCNITMHQLLRLIYIDQESPTQSLFYYEQFDNQTTRETVAELLMGIYDERLYDAKIRLKQLEEQLSESKSEKRIIDKSVTKEMRSPEHIRQLIDHTNGQIDQLSDDISRLHRSEAALTKVKSQAEQQRASVAQLRQQLLHAEDERERLEHETEDTRLFIDELKRKQQALRHSVSTRQVLGSLRLEYCPECLSPLSTNIPDGVCHLCKTPVEDRSGITQAKRLIAEISFQLNESENNLNDDLRRLDHVRSEEKKLRSRLKSQRRQLDLLLSDASSTRNEQLEDFLLQKGRLQGELLQYQTLLETAAYYEAVVHRIQKLESDIEKTRRYIAALETHQQARRTQIVAKMQQFGIHFLHSDLMRQRAFKEARQEDLHIDFSQNIAYLRTRHNKFSASSTFFLKLVARFSIFFASLELPEMRYPRFIFADNMEDKGIEKERAQHFQQTLIDTLSRYPADSYQVIYTTSYITDELDHSSYVVGDHYTSGNKSLKNV